MTQVVFEFDYAPEEMPVEKDAKIFEAGDYPDKEITISEADLDEIIRNFCEVPVKVEHTDSPLDPLGTVKRIWRRGRELFARLAFPRDMAAFLERRGIKKLSIALYRDPLRLAEVSLVVSPRVPTAAMFRESAADGVPGRLEVTHEMNDEKDREIEELRFALRTKDVRAKLASLKEQGKIVPASEPYAREILLRASEKIMFGEEETTIADVFERFIDAQPRVVVFGETAPGIRSEETPLSADEEELVRKLGISREQLRRYAPAGR